MVLFFSFQCNNCKQLVIHPDQRFSFFSDYSQIVSCPHCGVQEAHFAKNLPSIFAFIPRRGVTRVNSAWKKKSKNFTKKSQEGLKKASAPFRPVQKIMKKKIKRKKILRSFSETKNTAIVVAHIYVPSQKNQIKKPHNLKTKNLISQGSKHHFFGPARQEVLGWEFNENFFHPLGWERGWKYLDSFGVSLIIF